MSEIRTVIPDEIDQYLEAVVRTGPFASKAELVRAALVSYAQEAGPLAQGFDKDLLFSPDGRLYQVEYARESARRGAPVAGLVYDGGVLITAAYRKQTSVPCVGPKLTGKVTPVGGSILLAGSGLVADIAMVTHELGSFKGTTPEVWAQALRSIFWKATLERSRRPLGASMLLASTLGGQPRLFLVDPSGSITEADGILMGSVPEGATDRLPKEYRRGTAKEAEAFASSLLKEPTTLLAHHHLAV